MGIAPQSPAPSPSEPSPPPTTRAVPTAQSTSPPALTPRFAAAVLGGVAVVGTGFGVAFGVVALNDKRSFDAHPTFSAGNSGNENAVLADVCFGAAVVAAVTSLVLLVRSPSPEPSPDPAAGSASPATPAREKSAVNFSVSPMMTLHGGGAGASLRF